MVAPEGEESPYDYYSRMYDQIGRYYGWNWKTFELDTPYWRLKHWNDMLSDKLEDNSQPLTFDEMALIRTIALVMSGFTGGR